LLLLGGCGSIGFTPAAQRMPSGPAMAAADRPSLEIGDTFIYDDGGTIVREQVMGFAGSRVEWFNDRGVGWIASPDIVSPPLAWTGDPRLGRGQQQIFGDASQIFPLSVGKTVRFQVAGSSENVPDGWQAENRCTVTRTEEMKVRAGTFNTFRIECVRGEVIESFNYSPEASTYVLRLRSRGDSPPHERKELIDRQLSATPERMAMLPQVAAMSADKATSQAAPMASARGDSPPDMAALMHRLEALLVHLEKQTGMPSSGSSMARPGASGPASATAARPAPSPAAKAMPASAEASKSATKSDMALAMPPGGERFGAHLGSYRSADEAKSGWRTLTRQHTELLNNIGFQTTEFDPGDGRGTFIRLVAGPFEDRGKANQFCRDIQSRKVFCRVISLGPA
jgi:hypothetical protein